MRLLTNWEDEWKIQDAKYQKVLAERHKVRDQLIEELGLLPIINHSNYYLHMPTQHVYSFVGKEPRILKGGKGSTNYKLCTLRADDDYKFKSYGIHEVVISVKENLSLRSWKGFVCHHINGDIDDNSPENLVLMDKEEHRRLSKVLKKPKGSMTDEQVAEFRRDFLQSDLSKTAFAMIGSEKYGMNANYLIHVLNNKVRKQVTV
ncbi:HNH endonuclease [Shigella flexneri]|nr:HNH endonuclease [Shigella flexneri]